MYKKTKLKSPAAPKHDTLTMNERMMLAKHLRTFMKKSKHEGSTQPIGTDYLGELGIITGQNPRIPETFVGLRPLSRSYIHTLNEYKFIKLISEPAAVSDSTLYAMTMKSEDTYISKLHKMLVNPKFLVKRLYLKTPEDKLLEKPTLKELKQEFSEDFEDNGDAYLEIMSGYWLTRLSFEAKKVDLWGAKFMPCRTSHFALQLDHFKTVNTNMNPTTERPNNVIASQYHIQEFTGQATKYFFRDIFVIERPKRISWEYITVYIFQLIHTLACAWASLGYMHLDLHAMNVTLKLIPAIGQKLFLYSTKTNLNDENPLVHSIQIPFTVEVPILEGLGTEQHVPVLKIIDYGFNRMKPVAPMPKERITEEYPEAQVRTIQQKNLTPRYLYNLHRQDYTEEGLFQENLLRYNQVNKLRDIRRHLFIVLLYSEYEYDIIESECIDYKVMNMIIAYDIEQQDNKLIKFISRIFGGTGAFKYANKWFSNVKDSYRGPSYAGIKKTIQSINAQAIRYSQKPEDEWKMWRWWFLRRYRLTKGDVDGVTEEVGKKFVFSFQNRCLFDWISYGVINEDIKSMEIPLYEKIKRTHADSFKITYSDLIDDPLFEFLIYRPEKPDLQNLPPGVYHMGEFVRSVEKSRDIFEKQITDQIKPKDGIFTVPFPSKYPETEPPKPKRKREKKRRKRN